MKKCRSRLVAVVAFAFFVLMGSFQALQAANMMVISIAGYKNRAETLHNFPLLVVLSEGCDLAGNFSYANFLSPHGWDLRFRDGDDTMDLNYEIEQWDSSGVSLIWVQVPELRGDGHGSIIAKWGDPLNSAQLPCTTDGSVWDSDYKLVWHLKESGDGTLNEFRDSTANARHGRGGNGNAAAAPTQIDGMIGKGNLIDDVDDFIYISDGSVNALTIPADADFTFEAWVKPYKFVGANPGGWRTGANADGGSYNLFIGTSGRPRMNWNGSTLLNPNSGFALPLNEWTHFAFTVKSAAAYAFLANGAVEYSGTHSSKTAKIDIFKFGVNGSTERINGIYDEVRFSTKVRSEDWLWATFMCSASNSLFNIYDALAEGAPLVANGAVSSVGENAATLGGELLEGELPATITAYWGTERGVNDASSWQNSDDLNVAALGDIQYAITAGLISGQRYYYRFYAENSVAGTWAFGANRFATLGAPQVVTLPASDITQTSATLNGDLTGGNPAADVWIYWGRGDGGTDKNGWEGTALYVGQPNLEEFAKDLSGLLANQTYYYRAYAENSYGGAWAASSASFTTALPVATILNDTVIEGAAGTTVDLAFTVELSNVSGSDVLINFATANNTATVANNDYLATSGTLTIPAGDPSGTIFVTVLGDQAVEVDETLYLNLSNPVGATLANTRATGTIANDDRNIYVRGDGLGSDSNDGSSWQSAFATLQKALSTVPTASIPRAGLLDAPFNYIFVQASNGGNSYQPMQRSLGTALVLALEGGWNDVDTLPIQNGLSTISDTEGEIDSAGLLVTGGYHDGTRRISINNFHFTNVTRAIDITTGTGSDRADIRLNLTNVVIRSQSDGLYLNYPKLYAYSSGAGYGGLGQIVACNVDIVAGLGGSGDAIHIDSHWGGSMVTATGTDPLSGEPRYSRLSAPHGKGAFMKAVRLDAPGPAIFERTIIHDCGESALELSADRADYNKNTGSNRVQVVINHCTFADNGAGIKMISNTIGSFAAITNSVIVGNGGYAVELGESGFTCPEAYNVFFEDELLVNGVEQSVAETSSSHDPCFYAQKEKPFPWYGIGRALSPAWQSASDAPLHRGAWQGILPSRGTIIIFR